MKRRTTTVVIIEGIHDAALAARVYARIIEAVARVAPTPTVAKVIFADENGPKGGVDTRCTIVFHMPHRRDLSFTDLGRTGAVAFDAAHTALDTSVTRERARQRELVRRPKKFFLAKRLLAPDATLDALEAPATSSRPKRARRRRVA